MSDNKYISCLKAYVAKEELESLSLEIDKHFNAYSMQKKADIIHAFFYSIKISKLEMIELFLKKGISADEKNRYAIPALHVAISSAHPAPTMELLIRYGANLFIKDDMGLEPLMECARTGDIEAVNVILNSLNYYFKNGKISEQSYQISLANAIEESYAESNGAMREYLNSYFLSWQQKTDLTRVVKEVGQEENYLDSNFKI